MEEFEGKQIPSCTEEDLQKTIKASSSSYCYSQCGDVIDCNDCLFGVSVLEERRELLQRYLDHRYPQKIAVHCKTQEEWDRVCEKAKKDGYQWYNGNEYMPYNKTWDCLAFYKNKELMRGDRPCLEQVEHLKIISAQEYLGEERDIIVSISNPTATSFSFAGWFHSDGTFTNLNTKEEDMSASAIAVYIAEIYENLEDAVLVDKYMGAELEQSFNRSFTRKLWLTDKKNDYLAEAKRLEEESKKD